MEEIRKITEKYDPAYIEEHLTTVPALNQFALVFYKDVAEIYDVIVRTRDEKRNPNGFSNEDAPILGLLVRISKLLKELVRYYEEDNAEFISIFDRPLLEASIVATYLLTNDNSVIEDYRKCSYKDRLRILRDLKSGSAFFETKPGKRLLQALDEKFRNENLTPDDFEIQKKNRWRLQGKSFFEIFSIVEHADFYPSSYGMMSESIHGSWNESMDWCLTRNEDGTFLPFAAHHPADIRYVTPSLQFTIRPFQLWLERAALADDCFVKTLEWINRVNATLYVKFDEHFDGP